MAGIVLAVALALVMLASASVGQFAASIPDVIGALDRVLLHGASPDDTRLGAVLFTIRFPRTVLAVLVGASLATAGALLQGGFANPLAAPSVLGINQGASVGAGVVFLLGAAVSVPWALPLAAGIGAWGVALLMWGLARVGGRTTVLTLVLVGVAINALAVAVTGLLIFASGATSRQQIIFWQMGTLSGATWTAVGIAGMAFAVCLACSLPLRRRLDVLALGDVSATSTGVRVERIRFAVIALVSVLVGSAVAFGGVITFVGLVVPQAIRATVGPSHRHLVPLAALGGAVLVCGVDIAARTVIPFADVPVGILTAVIGGPVFLVMLRNTLRGHGIDQV